MPSSHGQRVCSALQYVSWCRSLVKAIEVLKYGNDFVCKVKLTIPSRQIPAFRVILTLLQSSKAAGTSNNSPTL